MRVRAYTDDRELRGFAPERALIYFPHGLGDFVHLSRVLPLLDPATGWAVTRIGDDFVSVFDGAPRVQPLHSGIAEPADGEAFGAAHFGLRRSRLNGGRRRLAIPAPLAEPVRGFAPDALLWPEFHDRGGHDPYPFHTKARRFARIVLGRQRASAALQNALPSAIPALVDLEVQVAVDARLRDVVARGERLCILVRGGHSDPLKTWGAAWREELPPLERVEGAEPRAFAAALARGALGGAWRILTFEDDTLGAGHAGWRGSERVTGWRTFASTLPPISFALALRAVLARTSLVVGVPAGPLHLALARDDVPTVGVWLHQHPDAYEEPHPLAHHVVGGAVIADGWERRRASRTLPPQQRHNTTRLHATRTIPAAAVLAAAETLLA